MTITESERARRIRFLLRDWKLWTGIAYFALLLTGLYLFNQRQDENARRADQARSAAVAEVTSCYTALRDGPDTVKLLSLVVFLADNSIRANSAALRTSASPELQRIRRASIARLLPQRETARRFVRRVQEATPTLAECKARARTLGIDPKPIRLAVNRR